MTNANTIDAFLNHSTREQGGGFLDGWKKDGHLEHFLHPGSSPTCLWAHPIPTIVPRENKQTRETENHVWNREYNCPETESVLKGQWYRNPDGSRERPPQACGVCKLLAWTYQRLVSGGLLLETPMFRFQGDFPAETLVVYAGGFVGELKSDRLKPETAKRLIAAGVSLEWKKVADQNSAAKAQYLAVVVAAKDAKGGAKIVRIAGGLGDKVKEAIREEMAKAAKPAQMRGASKEEIRAAASARDPLQSPYMFEWFYDENELNPGKKYRVTAHVDVKPSDEVMDQLRGEAPSLAKLTRPMNQAAVRARLERACLLQGKEAPPWDEFFPAAAEAAEEDPDMEFPPTEEKVPEIGAAPARTPPAHQQAQAPAKKTPEELCAGVREEDLFECEVCRNGSPTPEECVWCGARYDDQGNLIKAAPPPEAPKQMRARGGAKSATFKPKF